MHNSKPQTSDARHGRFTDDGKFIGTAEEAARFFADRDAALARAETGRFEHVDQCTSTIVALDSQDANDARAEEQLAQALNGLHRDVVSLEWWIGRWGRVRMREEALSDNDFLKRFLAVSSKLGEVKAAIAMLTPKLRNIRHARRLRAQARERVLSSMATLHRRQTKARVRVHVCRPIIRVNRNVRAHRVQRTTARRLAAKSLDGPDSNSDGPNHRALQLGSARW